MNSEIVKIYTETDYHILPLGLIVKIGERNARLDFEMERQSLMNFIIITAWNPRSVESEYEDNLIQNLKLLKDLVEEDLIIYPAMGKLRENIWKPEESWCVFNMSKAKGLELGVKYNQNAIVYGEIKKTAELLSCFG